jgi:D-glycero-alpha-D-manno-heptose-7-phosphate kinase
MIRTARAPVRIDFAGGTTDIPPFPQEHGGAVLNAAIDKYVEGKIEKTTKGLSLNYDCKVPTHFGLGTSGAMSLVWLALVLNQKNKKELAEGVFQLDRVLGLTSGKQDQYASAFGGINYLEFIGDKVKIRQINLSKAKLTEFENSLIIGYSEAMKRHQDLNKIVVEKLKNRNKKVIDSLENVKKITREMKIALSRGNFRKFADLMNLEWKNRKKMFPPHIPKQIDKVIKKGFEGGAIGAKPCGSCNGGVVLFYTKDKEKLKRDFNKLKKLKYLDFKIDLKGMQFRTQ